jgi:hypothetical protein
MVETALKPVPLPQAQWPIITKLLAFPSTSNFIYYQILIHLQLVDQYIYYCLYTGPRFDCPVRAKTLLFG